MSSEQIGHEVAESWGLDEEFEQTERLTKIWESHANRHQGTGYGEAVQEIARGYRLQLEGLRQDRLNPGQTTESPN